MFHLKRIKFGGIDWGNDGLGEFYAEGFSRVERTERVERDGRFLTRIRRDAECAERFGRVEHVERVEGDGDF